MKIDASQIKPKFRRKTSVLTASHTETNKSNMEPPKAEKKMRNHKKLLRGCAVVEKSIPASLADAVAQEEMSLLRIWWKHWHGWCVI